MKRLLCFLLAFAMLFGTVTVQADDYESDDPVESIEVVKGVSHKFVENEDGQFDERWNADTEEYEKYFNYEVVSWRHLKDVKIKINYKDGTSKNAGIYDYVDGYDVDWFDNQEETPWKLGNDNYITVSYRGHETNLAVEVIENPVESIEVVKGPSRKFIENADGWTSFRWNEDAEDYEEYFYYDYDFASYDDVEIKINYKDGTSKTVGIGDRKDGYNVDGYDVELSSTQEETPWKLGSDNYITLSYLGCETKLAVEVIESPVESIEVVKGILHKFVENNVGWFDERWNEDTGEYEEYFLYDVGSNDLEDAEIKINYKDGTSKTAGIGDHVDGYYVNYNSDQYYTPWKLGSDNYITVSYLGRETELAVEVIEAPVESIEVVKGISHKFVENVDGEISRKWNEITEEYDNYFWYEVDWNHFEDAEIKINYKDGTSKIAGIGDYVDGYYVECNYDQYNTPWKLGSDNYITVSYLGQGTKLSVEVIENPVERIEIVNAPAFEYVLGDKEFIGSYWDDEIDLFPTNIAGLSFEVYYNDGTNKQFTVKDNTDIGEFVGFHIDENLVFDGYRLRFSGGWDSMPELGDIPVNISYMGHTATYYITLKENPVESIEVSKLPDKMEFREGYEFDYSGMELTVKYTDGSSEVLKDLQLFYGDISGLDGDYDFFFDYKFHHNGYTGGIDLRGDNDYMYVTICYLGHECEFRGIDYIDDGAPVNAVVKRFSTKIIGTEVEVFFKDGTSELVKIEDYFGGGGTYYDNKYYFKTSKGILSLRYGYDDEEEEYYVRIGQGFYTRLKCIHETVKTVVENLVGATADAEGSYDSVTYCSACGEELGRETIVISKLVAKVEKFSDGKWYYTVDGKKDLTFIGFASNSNGRFRIEKGVVNFNYTDIVKDEDEWRYYSGGKWQKGTTSVEKRSNGTWWYVKNGVVQFGVTGLVKRSENNTWWYVKGGQVQFSFTDFADNGSRYRVEKGQVNFKYTDVVKDGNEWRYYSGGKWQTGVTSVEKRSNGTWWYVKNGVVQFGVTDVVKRTENNTWWYVKGGQVQTKLTSVVKKSDGTWWYIKNGQVQTNATGVVKRTDNNTWWYVKGGKIQFNFTGIAKRIDISSKWYVKNGQVQTGFSGKIKISGKTYTISKGKVK